MADELERVLLENHPSQEIKMKLMFPDEQKEFLEKFEIPNSWVVEFNTQLRAAFVSYSRFCQRFSSSYPLEDFRLSLAAWGRFYSVRSLCLEIFDCVFNDLFGNKGRAYPRYVQLLYFDQEENGGLSLALQEDSAKKGNITSAGMYFLCFPTYRLDQAAISMATTKDTDMAFFKKLDGFRPCEITELKAGTHVFAVYGDNFFRSASYQIEALCAAPFVEEKESLRAVEAQILSKKVELSNFETEYEEVLKHFTEMTSRYAQEMQAIDMLLKQRNEIKASYRVAPVIKSSSRSKKCKEAKEEGQLRGLRLRRTGSKSKNRSSSQEAKEDGQLRDESTAREKPRKKKWYKIPLKVHKR